MDEQTMLRDKRAVIKFTNIDAENFLHTYNGDPWLIGAGETQFFPVNQAKLFAKHLAMKLINKTKKLTAEGKADGTNLYKPENMQSLIERILGEKFDVPTLVEKSPTEVYREKVDEVNKILADKIEPQSVEMTKVDIISELKKKGEKVDVRKSKEELLAQLNEK